VPEVESGSVEIENFIIHFCELRSIEIFRAVASSVDYTKNLGFVGDHPVWNNKRRIEYDQLAGAGDPARSADLRMLLQ